MVANCNSRNNMLRRNTIEAMHPANRQALVVGRLAENGEDRAQQFL